MALRNRIKVFRALAAGDEKYQCSNILLKFREAINDNSYGSEPLNRQVNFIQYPLCVTKLESNLAIRNRCTMFAWNIIWVKMHGFRVADDAFSLRNLVKPIMANKGKMS